MAQDGKDIAEHAAAGPHRRRRIGPPCPAAGPRAMTNPEGTHMRDDPQPAAHPGPASGQGTGLRRVPVLNAHVHDIAMDELLDRLDAGMLLTLHTDMLVKLQTDRDFYEALDAFDIITCDSQILYFALRLMGTPVRERVSGSDFFPRFCARHRDDPEVTVFLCGGQPGVAERAAEKVNARTGRRIVVGTHAPPFDFDTDPAALEAMIDAINASRATVLVVGLGGGRQEKFLVANRHRFTHARLFLPLGGTIDYEAGTIRRPPPWVTDWGLEWLSRVIQEPRARWHRYFVQQPPALWLLLAQRLGRYRNPFAPPADDNGG